MVDKAFLPDFSEFFNKDELSDVNVVPDEDEAAACSSSGAGQKRKAPETDEVQGSLQRTIIPGHSMVLVAFSIFFRAQLRSWSEGTFPKPEIRLSVPAGQLELGELLLQAMYQPQPALGPLSQAQLLQLLQLQQQLGNLELVLSDSQKRQRLLALPHKVLLLLLQDEKTKVAAENTVFRSLESWNGYRQQHCTAPSDDEVMHLLRQIRMQHCTHPCVATVLSESPLAAKCFSPRDTRMACICSSAGGAPAEKLVAGMVAHKHPTIIKFPARELPGRPASSMRQLSMEREVSLKDLQLEVESMQDGLHCFILAMSGSWQGEEFVVQMKVAADAQLAGGKDKDKPGSNISSSTPFKVGIWGWPDLFGYGSVDSWAALEAKLRASNLVHAGNCLHIKVVVTEVM
ncbi:hypothetical protein COO60DRAFT_1641461 [Scenedesmus sp. NREL 46B-D3]|nr:hypothetical protein COO60DRAFT_1641461 [Scenedesmus sp. NREL 46B-D3]